MRYKITALAMVLFVSVFAAVAMADDNSTGNETNYSELDDFDSTTGASLRMLQLERAVSINLITGAETINVVQTNHPEANLTTLSAILNDIQNLLDDIKAYDVNLKTNYENAINFVAFKKEAVYLSKEFREEAQNYLTSDDRNEVKNLIKSSNSSIQGINDRIRERRSEMNAYRLGNLSGNLGFENETLLKRVRNGSADYSEVKRVLISGFANITNDERVHALLQLKDMQVNRSMDRDQLRESVSKEINTFHLEKEQERTQERTQYLQNHTGNMSMNEIRNNIIEHVGSSDNNTGGQNDNGNKGGKN